MLWIDALVQSRSSKDMGPTPMDGPDAIEMSISNKITVFNLIRDKEKLFFV